MDASHAQGQNGGSQEIPLKVQFALILASIAVLTAVACAPGAGAEAPPGSESATSGSASQSAQVFPTSTPWPQFGPPPVTAASITATVQAGPNAPVEAPGSEATPVPTVPSGTPLPGIDQVVTSPVPVETRTPRDDSGTFEPVMPYEFLIPLDWKIFVGTSEIVVAHRSDKAQVSLLERPADRSQAESIVDLAGLLEPVAFLDWSERSLFNVSVTGDDSLQFEYAGTKLGKPQVAVVDWYLWGELLIEVVTEADASAWAADTNLHNTAQLVAASFAPNTKSSLASAAEVQNLLQARFNHQPSNIFTSQSVGTEGGVVRTQLSCKQVLVDLVSQPVYVGSGTWQVFAVTEQGAQVWQIYEPTLNILPAGHNTSSC